MDFKILIKTIIFYQSFIFFDSVLELTFCFRETSMCSKMSLSFDFISIKLTYKFYPMSKNTVSTEPSVNRRSIGHSVLPSRNKAVRGTSLRQNPANTLLNKSMMPVLQRYSNKPLTVLVR